MQSAGVWETVSTVKWILSAHTCGLHISVFSPPLEYQQMGLLLVCNVTSSSSSFSASGALHHSWPSLSSKPAFSVGTSTI